MATFVVDMPVVWVDTEQEVIVVGSLASLGFEVRIAAVVGSCLKWGVVDIDLWEASCSVESVLVGRLELRLREVGSERSVTVVLGQNSLCWIELGPDLVSKKQGYTYIVITVQEH